MRLIYLNRNHYPDYAAWLGCFCGWISGNDRQCAIPDKGLGPSRRLILLAQAGYDGVVTACATSARFSTTGSREASSSPDMLRHTA
jgi:hypothetical protein